MVTAEPGLRVRSCSAGEVVALRQAVLRPHQTVAEVRLETGGHARVAHFCAEDEGGGVVCVASVWREAPPWLLDATDSWRLRGMATAPEWRGRGAGSAVLATVLAHVAAAGGGLLWCTARLGAVGFYERAGMVTKGDRWDEPFIGPHIAMYITVPGPSHRGVATSSGQQSAGQQSSGQQSAGQQSSGQQSAGNGSSG
jgi:GNAT superfamily N-acetyltransferase